jgi:hypothetical protein
VNGLFFFSINGIRYFVLSCALKGLFGLCLLTLAPRLRFPANREGEEDENGEEGIILLWLPWL